MEGISDMTHKTIVAYVMECDLEEVEAQHPDEEQAKRIAQLEQAVGSCVSKIFQKLTSGESVELWKHDHPNLFGAVFSSSAGVGLVAKECKARGLVLDGKSWELISDLDSPSDGMYRLKAMKQAPESKSSRS